MHGMAAAAGHGEACDSKPGLTLKGGLVKGAVREAIVTGAAQLPSGGATTGADTARVAPSMGPKAMR